MKEFAPVLDEYFLEGYSMYSKTIPESQWGNRAMAESYLEKYWLPWSEYEEEWKCIQDRIFTHQETGLPDMVFAPDFEVLVARGGCLFVREEFVRLQECVLALGDRHLLVVENTFAGRLKGPSFRMKYPADINWQELTGGNFASSIMLEMPHKEYFVFGESARWGKYSANDYEFPLDVIGFKRETGDVFWEKFSISEAEHRDIASNLPPAYKSRIAHRRPLRVRSLHSKDGSPMPPAQLSPRSSFTGMILTGS